MTAGSFHGWRRRVIALAPALAMLGVSIVMRPGSSLALWEMLRTEAAEYADTLEDKLHGFDKQAADTLAAYDDASIARHFAAKGEFASDDEETMRFLSKWDDAASEAEALADDYDDLVREAKLFFSYLKKQAAGVKDRELRESVNREISMHETKFIEVLGRATSGLKGLREAIQSGADVVRAIRIQAAPVVIEEKVDKAAALGQRSMVQAETLRVIARDGLHIVDEILRRLELTARQGGG